ncbi:MAG TPA: hypothetical protein VH120_20465 [Gemmataceae bacterium]|jgi:hypothetical protein|nr:hypothetical protein [Gemmataceae bacterium]
MPRRAVRLRLHPNRYGEGGLAAVEEGDAGGRRVKTGMAVRLGG